MCTLYHIHFVSFPGCFNQVKLNILVHEDLSIVGDTPDDLTVPAKSSESFDLNLLTRGIGRLRITIRAAVRGKKYSDTVEKMLFVKVRTYVRGICVL